MKEQQIDTIIFDLGGVLIKWDPRRLFRKIFVKESDMEDFLNTVCTMHWNELQDGGRTIAKANKELIAKYPVYENEILAYYGRWEEMLGGAIEGTVEILDQLYADKKYKLVALTNWSHQTFPIALERFEFLQHFEDILVSGVEKLKKPDPKIYQLALKRFDVKAENAIFIDDSLRNIKAASKEGIHTIHFKSSSQLKRDLKKRGIL